MNALSKMDEPQQHQENTRGTIPKQPRTFAVALPQQQLGRIGADFRRIEAYIREV